MNAVIEHGTPLVDDPKRIGAVKQLDVDETSFLRANRVHPTIYATGLVDLRAKVLIDMVEGNTAADLRRWTKKADSDWIAGIEVVATDLAQSFRAGLSPKLDHAVRVADPFHVVRVGNRCLDKVRRRVQNETLGHRGPHTSTPPRWTFVWDRCSPRRPRRHSTTGPGFYEAIGAEGMTLHPKVARSALDLHQQGGPDMESGAAELITTALGCSRGRLADGGFHGHLPKWLRVALAPGPRALAVLRFHVELHARWMEHRPAGALCAHAAPRRHRLNRMQIADACSREAGAPIARFRSEGTAAGMLPILDLGGESEMKLPKRSAAVAQKPARSMSDFHKEALAKGREQGRAVRRYLEALEANKPRRGRKRTAEGIQKRLVVIEERLASADALSRLHLAPGAHGPRGRARHLGRRWRGYGCPGG